MNRLLLLIATVLIATAANAQMKRSELAKTTQRPNLQLMKPEVKMEEMQMRTPGTPVVKAPKKADNVNVWYRRPAGAFTSSVAVENGVYAGFLYAPYLNVKPYSYYTFLGFAEGVSGNAQYYWDVQYWDNIRGEQTWTTVEGQNLTWQWGYEIDEVPTFNVIDNGEHYSWDLHGYEKTSSQPAVYQERKANLLSVPCSIEEIWDMDLLKSSKNFSYGKKEDQLQPMIIINGPDPYGQNEKGWWFGKNGGMNNYRIDGIAQAFEKPEHPYLLKQVVMECAMLTVVGPVDICCKIYKIDEIPPYVDDGVATLPEVPGELIATGRASLTPETNDNTGGLVFFTLYNEDDGLEYEVTPTIDDAILVVVDGYNDPEMDNLRDFTAMISSNDDEDEGFGELAYLKLGVPDEEGNLDHYVWTGLNNFFASGTKKTGLTIFLSTELPYLTFNYYYEDGEYTFPVEGGGLVQPIGDYIFNGIEFWSWVPSLDDGWTVSCNGEEIPDWLTIELEDDIKEGEFSGLVTADVVAEPLPDGVKYREAIVRFAIPGAYIDCKFKQGPKVGPTPPTDYDVNKDGEVNLGDVNALLNIFFDLDPVVAIPFFNALIDYILGHPHQPMPW